MDTRWKSGEDGGRCRTGRLPVHSIVRRLSVKVVYVELMLNTATMHSIIMLQLRKVEELVQNVIARHDVVGETEVAYPAWTEAHTNESVHRGWRQQSRGSDGFIVVED